MSANNYNHTKHVELKDISDKNETNEAEEDGDGGGHSEYVDDGNYGDDGGGGGADYVDEKKRFNKSDTFDYKEIESMLPEELDNLFGMIPLTKETTCGFWMFKGWFLQRCANKKVYSLLYGITGCILGATYAYFGGTITTLEKRYKIPSRNMGIISVGNDVSQMLISTVLSYYAGKGHRPRWMALGLLTTMTFCFLNVVPHFLYGIGDEAMQLTEEYAKQIGTNITNELSHEDNQKGLCQIDGDSKCEVFTGSMPPQIILFISQFISGIGQPLYYTLGSTYMDDNIQKSKTAAFISYSYFLRMFGPPLGLTLASLCLRFYISPSLTPTIKQDDPRWLGAWWMGWIALGSATLISAFLLSLFPATLPRAAVRRIIHKEKIRRELSMIEPEDAEPSISDMLKSFKRVLFNPIYVFNNLASVFYIFAYMPYWTYSTKYIEIQYRTSASVASLATGAVPLVFTAMGLLFSGIFVSKLQPSARSMAAWNVLVGIITVLGIMSYTFLGCADNDRTIALDFAHSNIDTCSSNCHCDYVQYSPICGDNGKTYISPCHAGCTDFVKVNNEKIFTNCSCVSSQPKGPITQMTTITTTEAWLNNNSSKLLVNDDELDYSSTATVGSCPVNCFSKFMVFLAVMCVLKFVGSTGRATNFLISMRCVAERDKTISFAFSLMFLSLFAFIPSPIFFGYLMDKTCAVWGRTCEGTGNCWLYNSEALRWSLNSISASIMAIGSSLDACVWYYSKNLVIFEDTIKPVELNDLSNKSEKNNVDNDKSIVINNL